MDGRNTNSDFSVEDVHDTYSDIKKLVTLTLAVSYTCPCTCRYKEKSAGLYVTLLLLMEHKEEWKGRKSVCVCVCASVSVSYRRVPSVRKNNWLLAPDQELIIRLLPLDEAVILLKDRMFFPPITLLLYLLHSLFKLQVILALMFNSTFTLLVSLSALVSAPLWMWRLCSALRPRKK